MAAFMSTVLALAAAAASLAGQTVASPLPSHHDSSARCLGSYGACRYRFEDAKEACSTEYDYRGASHVLCIDSAVLLFDKCIAAVDQGGSFCWDSGSGNRLISSSIIKQTKAVSDDSSLASDDDGNDAEESSSRGREPSGRPSAPVAFWSKPVAAAAADASSSSDQQSMAASNRNSKSGHHQRRAIVSMQPDPTQPAGASIAGSVMFVQDSASDTIQIIADLVGLPPGQHGWHVHVSGNIFPNCSAAGLHFNPFKQDHGAPDARVRHVGDFGNMNVGPDGRFKHTLTDTQASLWDHQRSIVGRALVIHANVDDLGLTDNPQSKIVGNAGGRLACGVLGIIAV
ncbi:superoxide dismutase [Entophlyctis helioformis]|nr:superoxide dismutase [Entophlyctis helioformis]